MRYLAIRSSRIASKRWPRRRMRPLPGCCRGRRHHIDSVSEAICTIAMTGEPPMSTNEKRRGEPEIIPPGRYGRESGAGRAHMRVFVDGSITRHVFVARLGPLGALLVALIIAIACAMILVLFLSVFLIS